MYAQVNSNGEKEGLGRLEHSTHSSIMVSTFKDVGCTIHQGYCGADLHPVSLKQDCQIVKKMSI